MHIIHEKCHKHDIFSFISHYRCAALELRTYPWWRRGCVYNICEPDRFAIFFGNEATSRCNVDKTANKSKNRDLFVQTCRKVQIEKVYASRFKRKFIAYLSSGFAVLSAHTMCAEVNEHRYACISIKGKYDERKTGHVAAVFRTCRAHNASDRSLSMWRR